MSFFHDNTITYALNFCTVFIVLVVDIYLINFHLKDISFLFFIVINNTAETILHTWHLSQ